MASENLNGIHILLDSIGVYDHDHTGDKLTLYQRVDLLVDQCRRQATEICRLRHVDPLDLLGDRLMAQFERDGLRPVFTAEDQKILTDISRRREADTHGPAQHLHRYPDGCDDLGCRVCAENIEGRGGPLRLPYRTTPGEIQPTEKR